MGRENALSVRSSLFEGELLHFSQRGEPEAENGTGVASDTMHTRRSAKQHPALRPLPSRLARCWYENRFGERRAPLGGDKACMNDLPLDSRKLGVLASQCRHCNVFPIFLGNYYHDPKPHPVSNLLKELVDEAVQYLRVMTESEVSCLVASLPPAARMYMDLSGAPPYDKTALHQIALRYLGAAVQRDYLSFRTIVTAEPRSTEVLTEFPELWELMDGDGLLHLGEGLTPLDVGILYRGYILHYHQFLRRGYSSNVNYNFTTGFREYYLRSHHSNRFSVALDLHRFTPKDFYARILEEDTWFGPHFDRSRLDDVNATGLTVVARRRPSIFDRTNQLDRTEFYWSVRGGVKTLEIEELSSKERVYDSYYLNRYAHTERDTHRAIIGHFDGAVKVYLKSEYASRMDAHIPQEPRSYKKVKMFRIDGDIDIDIWIQLLANFYKSNEMVIEYFDPQQYQQHFAERNKRYREIKDGTAKR